LRGLVERLRLDPFGAGIASSSARRASRLPCGMLQPFAIGIPVCGGIGYKC